VGIYIIYSRGRMKRKRKGMFASLAEQRFAKEMDSAKITWIYEADSFHWWPPRRKYTPDFKVYKKDCSFFYVEYKGYLRPGDRTKMRAIKDQYPQLDIRFVFQNAKKKLYKGSKTTYAEWAERYGFPWADKMIPKEWL